MRARSAAALWLRRHKAKRPDFYGARVERTRYRVKPDSWERPAIALAAFRRPYDAMRFHIEAVRRGGPRLFAECCR